MTEFQNVCLFFLSIHLSCVFSIFGTTCFFLLGSMIVELPLTIVGPGPRVQREAWPVTLLNIQKLHTQMSNHYIQHVLISCLGIYLRNNLAGQVRSQNTHAPWKLTLGDGRLKTACPSSRPGCSPPAFSHHRPPAPSSTKKNRTYTAVEAPASQHPRQRASRGHHSCRPGICPTLMTRSSLEGLDPGERPVQAPGNGPGATWAGHESWYPSVVQQGYGTQDLSSWPRGLLYPLGEAGLEGGQGRGPCCPGARAILIVLITCISDRLTFIHPCDSGRSPASSWCFRYCWSPFAPAPRWNFPSIFISDTDLQSSVFALTPSGLNIRVTLVVYVELGSFPSSMCHSSFFVPFNM